MKMLNIRKVWSMFDCRCNQFFYGAYCHNHYITKLKLQNLLANQSVLIGTKMATNGYKKPIVEHPTPHGCLIAAYDVNKTSLQIQGRCFTVFCDHLDKPH